MSVVKQDLGFILNGTSKHDPFIQFHRRTALAKSRNILLSSALKDEDYVLWLDCDLWEYKQDLLLQLLAAEVEIVTANCVMEYGYNARPYDLNNWQETESSLLYGQRYSDEILFVEGYGTWGRRKRKNFSDPEMCNQTLVPLDGVGGTALLIKADLHRQGLIFPPFVFKHQIETEGLAKMAKSMGYQPYGMPFVQVIHH